MDKAYSVTELTSYIKRSFDMDMFLNRIYVKGEVSNCKYHTSGHIYFTLKDSNAQIACVMFAGKRPGISFRLEDGQSVIVLGSVSVYEAAGKYQIYADEIRLDGIGRLYEMYEELKKKLDAEGLFDVSHKVPIPKYARTVGIVTASTGAAIQDICKISKRRNPYVKLFLYPAQVQGTGASDTIVKGIRALDGKVDVIIVGRGGGSIEDLWAFNEEKTARAIYTCRTPIISAVGHETDWTISDYVADLRASTPSAGAELAVYDIKELERTFAILHERLYGGMETCINVSRERVKRLEEKLKLRSPSNRLLLQKKEVKELSMKLERAMNNVINEKRMKMKYLSGKLLVLDPVKKLESGFSYVTNENGENVTSVKGLRKDDNISITVTDGVIKAKITEIK